MFEGPLPRFCLPPCLSAQGCRVISPAVAAVEPRAVSHCAPTNDPPAPNSTNTFVWHITHARLHAGREMTLKRTSKRETPDDAGFSQSETSRIAQVSMGSKPRGINSRVLLVSALYHCTCHSTPPGSKASASGAPIDVCRGQVDSVCIAIQDS